MAEDADLRVRSFPADLKAKLKSEAALAHQTMGGYIISILESRAELPGFDRLFRRKGGKS